jgi:hypothetical protein
MCRLDRVDQRNVFRIATGALAASFSSFTLVAPALAQTGGLPADDGVRLEYQAPAGCPDEAAFRRELHARNRRLRSGQRIKGDVSVTLVTTDHGMSGSLVLRAGGKTGTREFEGASCSEVVAGLALVAAVDLDEAPPPPIPETAAERIPAEPPPAPSPKPKTGLQIAVGAHASMTSGVSDGLLFGAPVFIEINRRSLDLVSPSVRAIFEGTVSGQVVESVGALHFTWFTGAVEACPIRIGPAVLEMRPCARVELGALGASPRGVSFGHGATQPWASAGAVVRLAWAPTSMIFLEIEGGGRLPIVRPAFEFLPATTLYRVPSASALVETGLGLRFN